VLEADPRNEEIVDVMASPPKRRAVRHRRPRWPQQRPRRFRRRPCQGTR
jgi:hypothetical protein